MSPRRSNVAAGTRLRVGLDKAAKSGAAPAGCGGVAAKFGKIYKCPSLSGTRQDIFTVTTTVDDDVLYGTVTQTRNSEDYDSAAAAVYDADGNYLCYFSSYPSSCELGAAGTYTVAMSLSYGIGDVAYTLSLQSLKTPSSCRTLGNKFFSFASPGRTTDIPLGSAGQCYTFDQPAGDVLYVFSPHATSDVRGEILDADYQPVCPVQSDGECALTGAGPYRVMIYESYGNAAKYTLRMARLSNSTGCPLLKAASFGDPGNATGTGTLDGQNTVCHQLRAPAAGGVAIRIHNDQLIWWTVYDDDGKRVCDKYDSAWSCYLPAAGDYTILTTNQDWNPITYQIAATALYRSAGCSTGTSWHGIRMRRCCTSRPRCRRTVSSSTGRPHSG